MFTIDAKKLKAMLSKCKHKTYNEILEKGTPSQQYEMAECFSHDDGLFMKDTVKLAETLYIKAADSGHLEAAYRAYQMASFLKNPSGMKYLKMAAKNGHDRANHMLIRCYLFGDGICKSELNPKKGIKLLEQRVKEKNEQAYALLSQCYERGVGVPVDLKMAIYYSEQMTSPLKSVAIDRIKMVMKERENPSKKLREEIVKEYEYNYKIENDKLVPI
jgi:hypothetical protein